MKNIVELSYDFKLAWVQYLMMDCPMGKALESCPIKNVRALSQQEILALAKKMKEHQHDKIIMHHKRCLKERGGV